jgi:hypothetical protein
MEIRPIENRLAAAVMSVCALLTACGGNNTASLVREQGSPATATTRALEAGSRLLQSTTPVDGLHIYLDGFHPMRENAAIQMEAHHYCNQLNEDFAQCALFDGNSKDAKLNGIEYIVSERIFQTLGEEEKKLWHPHNYEILSGQLIGPGLPDVAEKALLRRKMNSYGKTWHVWMTDSHGKAVDSLPLGQPHLAWSFNHDGEADPVMVRDRNRRMSVPDKRQQRTELRPLAHPQEGEDAMSDQFKAP